MFFRLILDVGQMYISTRFNRVILGEIMSNADLLVLVTLARQAPVNDLDKGRLAKEGVNIVVIRVFFVFFCFLSHIFLKRI